MMGSRIAAGLAVLLALAGWGLYHQISANGGLKKQIEQREQQLRDATSAIDALAVDIKARDDASKLLGVERAKVHETEQEVRVVVRKVYVQPDVQPWAETVPPAAVVDSVGAGIDQLWSTAAGDDNAHGGAVAPGGDDGGLPAP